MAQRADRAGAESLSARGVFAAGPAVSVVLRPAAGRQPDSVQTTSEMTAFNSALSSQFSIHDLMRPGSNSALRTFTLQRNPLSTQ